MTAPYLHDQIFEDLRLNGPEPPPKPKPEDIRQRADAARVGTPQPRLTRGEAGRQVMRGLARAGVETAMSPVTVTRAVSNSPTPIGVVARILSMLNPFKKLEEAREEELTGIDEFYGTPETGGGRGVSLVSQLLGEGAMGAGFAPKRVPSAPTRAVPTVRAATDAEIRQVADALRRAPEGSPERRLFDDFFGNTAQREHAERVGPHTSPSIQDLEDLLNLRAFGSRRGPFSTSGKHSYDIGDLPPIAGADDIAEVNARPLGPADFERIGISEQMERQAPELREAIHAERLREEALNLEMRDVILEEGIPGFRTHQVKNFRNVPVQVESKPLDFFRRFIRNERGEIPLGPIEDQLGDIRARPRLNPRELTDEQIAWATGREDLLPSQSAGSVRVVSRFGRVTESDNLKDALQQAGYQHYFDELADREGLVGNLDTPELVRERFRDNPYMKLEENARDMGTRFGRFADDWRVLLDKDKDFQVLFENRLGEVLPFGEYGKRMETLRETLQQRYSQGGRAGLSILGALTAAGAAGTTAAAKGKKK